MARILAVALTFLAGCAVVVDPDAKDSAADNPACDIPPALPSCDVRADPVSPYPSCTAYAADDLSVLANVAVSCDAAGNAWSDDVTCTDLDGLLVGVCIFNDALLDGFTQLTHLYGGDGGFTVETAFAQCMAVGGTEFCPVVQ